MYSNSPNRTAWNTDRDRVDDPIDYPFAFQLDREGFSPQKQDELLFLSEHEELTLKTVHAICDNLPEGRIAIELINRIALIDGYFEE